MFDYFTKSTLVPLLLRLGLAVIFLYHGAEKVTREGNELGAAWAKAPPGQETMPRPMQLAVAWGELLGGAALAIGLLSRLAAAGIAVIMIGAIAVVHGRHGFPMNPHFEDGQLIMGYEYNFLILVVCAAVILLGSGTLSVDRFFRWRKRTGQAA
jgi:putative oxidoreductase